MISPPAANLIVRNREEIRGCGRLTVYQSGSRRVYIGTLSLWSALSRGTTGHKGLFFAADPLSRLFAQFSFSLFQVLVDVVPPPPPLPPPPVAKTSFESPVSALHAEAFVAARILLNMRRSPKSKQASKCRENRGGGEFSQIVV